MAAARLGVRPRLDRLYALTAAATAKAMADAPTEADARSIERQMWANMALNTGWSWLFFTAQRPKAALAIVRRNP